MGSGLVSSTYAKVFQQYEGKPLDIAAVIAEAREAAEKRGRSREMRGRGSE